MTRSILVALLCVTPAAAQAGDTVAALTPNSAADWWLDTTIHKGFLATPDEGVETVAWRLTVDGGWVGVGTFEVISERTLVFHEKMKLEDQIFENQSLVVGLFRMDDGSETYASALVAVDGYAPGEDGIAHVTASEDLDEVQAWTDYLYEMFSRGEVRPPAPPSTPSVIGSGGTCIETCIAEKEILDKQCAVGEILCVASATAGLTGCLTLCPGTGPGALAWGLGCSAAYLGVVGVCAYDRVLCEDAAEIHEELCIQGCL